MVTPQTYFYQVKPFPSRSGWGARVWITSDWCLSIISDWGNYGYWWHPESNRDFRAFLCRCDEGYLWGKLTSGQKSVLDPEGTERLIKEHILQYRRRGSYTKEFASIEWHLLKRSSFENEVDAHDWYMDTDIQDAASLICYELPPRALEFIRRCWPPLVAEMRRDIGAPMRAKAHAWFQREISYDSPRVPADYVCSTCKATGCKLWRPANAFPPIELKCCYCSAASQKADITSIDDAGTVEYDDFQRCDQIGFLLPAVPALDNSGYWSYTMVPESGVAWWRSLPTKPTNGECIG